MNDVQKCESAEDVLVARLTMLEGMLKTLACHYDPDTDSFGVEPRMMNQSLWAMEEILEQAIVALLDVEASKPTPVQSRDEGKKAPRMSAKRKSTGVPNARLCIGAAPAM